MVDTRDLKSLGSDTVPVRVRSPAPSGISQIYRGVEQLAARRAHNPEVVGSSPAAATRKSTRFSENRVLLLLFEGLSPFFWHRSNKGRPTSNQRPGKPGRFSARGQKQQTFSVCCPMCRRNGGALMVTQCFAESRGHRALARPCADHPGKATRSRQRAIAILVQGAELRLQTKSSVKTGAYTGQSQKVLM